MDDGDRVVAAFIGLAGWGEASRSLLAGDASGRRYLRLKQRSGETAVLMHAPGSARSTRAFLEIARHLSSLGLSSPGVLAEAADDGLLLLEDLGDALFARLVDDDPGMEKTLYLAAAETLASLQSAPPPPGLDRFDPERMAHLVREVLGWYAPDRAAAPDDVASALRDTLADLAPEPTVLALRDVHAENLVWLPGRTGPSRTGLLDFQDAVLAHPAYDLVSLLHDVRRDVAAPVREATLRRFLDLTGHDDGAFPAASAVISVQRNLRILGVFARLAVRDGKAGYLRHLPRTWTLIVRELGHPALSTLRDAVLAALPPVTDATMKQLEARCVTPVP